MTAWGTMLDETYRKAGKMNPKKLVTCRDVEATRLLNTVRLDLLSKVNEERTVRAELYELNVYGECDAHCSVRVCGWCLRMNIAGRRGCIL